MKQLTPFYYIEPKEHPLKTSFLVSARVVAESEIKCLVVMFNDKKQLLNYRIASLEEMQKDYFVLEKLGIEETKIRSRLDNILKNVK